MLSESYKKRLLELSGVLNELVIPIDQIYAKYYKDIHSPDFNQIVLADPTSYGENGYSKKMGIYSKWLLSLFKKKLLKLEDLYKATEYLELFHKNKNLIQKDGFSPDINHYKNLPQLLDVVKKYRTAYKPDVENVEDENELLNNDYFIENGEATIKDLGVDWIVVVPKTLAASKFYGCSSEWCTINPNQFDYYSHKGDLNIFINKDKIGSSDPNRRIQVHVEENQFMNMNDYEIERQIFFDQNPEVFDYLYEKYKEKIHHSDIKVVGNKFYLITSGWQDFADNFNTGRDISVEFIKGVLGGDSFEFFSYDTNAFETKYFLDDINDESHLMIRKAIKKINKKANLRKYKDMDDLYSFISENSEFDEIDNAILQAGISSQESADADEAYTQMTKAITSHFQVIGSKWGKVPSKKEGENTEKLFVQIPESLFKSAFFSDRDSFIDALANSEDDTLIDYSPPYNGYSGDIDKNYFNEDLQNRLSDL